jgi:RNA polymerase sigma-70 factor (ECF subfamily)
MSPLEGWDLDAYRRRLRTRAGILLHNPRLRLRFDESDVVSETLKRAVRSHTTYDGGANHAERFAWLQRIQDRVLIDLYEAATEKKRDFRREQVQQVLAESSLAWDPAADQSTPSEAASRNEEQARVLAALEHLAPRERDLVRAIHLDQLSLTDAAARVGMSTGHASRVYPRALQKLRDSLSKDKDRTP